MARFDISRNWAVLLVCCAASWSCTYEAGLNSGLEHEGENFVVLSTPQGDMLVEYEIDNGEAIVEGDINLGPVSELKLDEASDLGGEAYGIADRSRNFLTTNLWNGPTIPYVLSISNTTYRDRMLAAIAHWNSRTTVQLAQIAAPPTSGNYILFTDATLSCTTSHPCCRSNLGPRSPTRVDSRCNDLGASIHEIGHAIGLAHEHIRPNRNTYITGVPTGADWDINATGAELSDYDYQSVMHYASAGTTMTKVGGGTVPYNTVLSPYDILGTQVMFGNEFEPTLAAVGDGAKVDYFVRGGDAHLYAKSYNGSTWNTYIDLGSPPGGIVGAPEAIKRSGGRVDILVRGSDNVLYYKGKTTSGSWFPSVSALENLGGTIASHPTAVATGGERIDIFARSPSGDLMWKYFDAGWHPSTTGWDTTTLSSVVPLGPIAVVRGSVAGTMHLFVTDVNKQVYYSYFNGTAWGAFASMGGAAYGRIVAVLNGSSVEVVVRGGDQAIHRKRVIAPYSFSPAGGHWQLIGSDYTGVAALTSRLDGTIEAFAHYGPNRELRRTILPSTTSASAPLWIAMGGLLIGSPIAVSGVDGRVDLLVRGSDSGVYYRRRLTATGAFSSFDPLGGFVSW